MPKVTHLSRSTARRTAGAVPSSSLAFRLSAWGWRRTLALGSLLERAGERALDLSLFRAGAFLKRPLPRRVRVHPALAARTTGMALAALFHRIAPFLESRGLTRAFNRRRSRAATALSRLARQPERAMPFGIALLLGIAVSASLLPGAPEDPRLSIGGDAVEVAADDGSVATPLTGWGGTQSVDHAAADVADSTVDGLASDTAVVGDLPSGRSAGWRTIEPPYVDQQVAAGTTDGFGAVVGLDGRLTLPAAVDLQVHDGSDHVIIHVVERGQRLANIAKQYKIDVMELLWSNNLKTLDTPSPGTRLRIPDVKGIVHVVTENETLSSIAARAGVSKAKIIEYNGLVSPNIILGMVLVIPGGRGAALPTFQVGKGQWAYAGPRPSVYSGTTLKYPVQGGHYVRGFFRGHEGMDIAAPYGTPIMSAAAGVVTRVGWGRNCGWFVFVAHGSNLYTGYCHMSKILASPGQRVARGEVIGRIGTSGKTTGPHVHFVVSRGEPFSYRCILYDPARFLP